MLPLDKKPILLFEFGNIQVFCYQTIEEWSAKSPPKEIFWRSKDVPLTINGPFSDLHSAVHSWSSALKPPEPMPDNIIPIDFKTKKRIKPAT